MLDKLIAGALQGMTAGQGTAANPMMQIGLMQQFQQAGLGQQAGSWVSTGANLPISADQLSKVLGGSQLQQMASIAGMEPSQFGDQLSQLLPQLIDQLTPNGQMPTGGVEDPLAALSNLIPR